jgi:2,4-dienoyl-CoA reductase-like NADH-dependent reductase (Old Yellow Enzyme family)
MLFSPLTMRAGRNRTVTARNRVFLAPLTNQGSHPDGAWSTAEAEFLSRRAQGGFGLVETCAAYVRQEGKAWSGELGVHDDAMLPGMTALAARLRAGGALSCVQLFHGGLRADPSASGLPRLSASDDVEPDFPARGASDAEVHAIIDAFAAAAARCARAGFDAVELHGAHGYLLSQFQSSVYNRRADRWGGDLAGRARLIREVARAVRAAAPDLMLMVRLSPEEYGQAKGIDLDETLQIAKWLVEDGVDALHLSLWRAELNTTKRPDVHATPLFRDAVGPDVPLVVAGNVWTGDEAEAQLARGADAVALGRSAIGWHDWPRRVAAGETPSRPPFTAEHLAGEGLSPPFVNYMRRWKGFLAE